MPEAMSWTHEAHCVKLKLASDKSLMGSPGPGCTSGGGGGTASREHARRTWFSDLLKPEVPNGASNS